MRWIVSLILCLTLVQAVQAQQPSNVITAMGVCLSVLDLGIRSHTIQTFNDPHHKSKIIALKNTLAIYKDLIKNAMPTPVQLQIVQSYMVIKQEFIDALSVLEDAELEDFVQNLNQILDQCVGAASYQSGITE